MRHLNSGENLHMLARSYHAPITFQFFFNKYQNTPNPTEIYKKTGVQKMLIHLKTKTFVLKSMIFSVISSCSRIGKFEKAHLLKQIEILLSMVSRTLHCAIKRVKNIHTPYQFYNTNFIPCKNPKILIKPAFVSFSFRDNLVNSLCESMVNCERSYSKILSSFSFFVN